MLKSTKNSAVKARTQAVNQMNVVRYCWSISSFAFGLGAALMIAFISSASRYSGMLRRCVLGAGRRRALWSSFSLMIAFISSASRYSGMRASLCGVSPVQASSGKTNRHPWRRPPGQCGALSHSRRQTALRPEDAGVPALSVSLLRRPVFWGNARVACAGVKALWSSFSSHHSFRASLERICYADSTSVSAKSSPLYRSGSSVTSDSA